MGDAAGYKGESIGWSPKQSPGAPSLQWEVEPAFWCEIVKELTDRLRRRCETSPGESERPAVGCDLGDTAARCDQVKRLAVELGRYRFRRTDSARR